MTALLIVLLLASPIVLAPPYVLLSRRRYARRLRRGIMGPLLMKGTLRLESHWKFPGAPGGIPIYDPCEQSVVVCSALKPCGGTVAELIERYVAEMKEADRPLYRDWFEVRIGRVCLRCGHLDAEEDSHVVGPAFLGFRTAADLVRFLRGERDPDDFED